MALILGFGLIFEFPLVIFVLARIGIVDSAWLRKQRKYAILVSAVAAAVLTPTTDAISFMFMFVPIHSILRARDPCGVDVRQKEGPGRGGGDLRTDGGIS